MPDPLDPVEALRRIVGDMDETWTRNPPGDSRFRDQVLHIARAALAALPAPEPTLTGEETVNWYGLLRSSAAILPEVETPERLLVAARNLAADIDAALAPYPTSFYLPSAAPVPKHILDGFDENRVWMSGEWWEITSWHGQPDEYGQYEAWVRRLDPQPPSPRLPAPVPEGVPEDHRVCSHGIYHHGCLSCDRQDPEERL